MSFHQRDFAQRFGAMGDEAEAKFEQTRKAGYVRFGLNRPPLRLSLLPERLRHAPDYLTSSHFYECKGMGRDDVLKLKVDEFSCMNFWHQLHPLRLFVWSTKRKATADTSLEDLRALINEGAASLDTFHDGKAYFAIPGENLAWTPLETAVAA